MSATPASGTTYIRGIEGIRAIAVLLVLAFHTDGQPLPGGFIGVDVFFVVSGYLITTQLLRSKRSVRVFFVRRLARLWPALLVAVGFTVLITGLEGGGVAPAMIYAATYTFNLVAAHQIDIGDAALVSHTWSLAIELQFYLAWGLLLTVLGRRGTSARRLFQIAAAIGLGSLVIRVIYALVLDDRELAYFATEARLDAIFVGCAFAVLVGWAPATAAALAHPAAGLGLIAITAAACQFGSVAGLVVAIPAAAVGTLTILAAVVRDDASRIVGLLKSAPFVRLGIYSYSLYLWHFPVFGLLLHHTSLEGAALIVAEWLVAMVCAVGSYHLVENPARRVLYARIAARNDARFS